MRRPANGREDRSESTLGAGDGATATKALLNAPLPGSRTDAESGDRCGRVDLSRHRRSGARCRAQATMTSSHVPSSASSASKIKGKSSQDGRARRPPGGGALSAAPTSAPPWVHSRSIWYRRRANVKSGHGRRTRHRAPKARSPDQDLGTTDRSAARASRAGTSPATSQSDSWPRPSRGWVSDRAASPVSHVKAGPLF